MARICLQGFLVPYLFPSLQLGRLHSTHSAWTGRSQRFITMASFLPHLQIHQTGLPQPSPHQICSWYRPLAQGALLLITRSYHRPFLDGCILPPVMHAAFREVESSYMDSLITH